MINSLLITAIVLIASAIPLLAEDLSFNTTDSATVTTYDLQLKDSNKVKTIWSGQVPLVDGTRPAAWYSLGKWKKNDQGMLVLVNYDNFQGKLLLFGPNDEFIAEMNVGMEWLRSDRFGTVMLEPPDKIKFIGYKGEIRNEYIIKNGGLYYKDGTPYERNPAAVQAIEGPSKHTSGQLQDAAPVADSPQPSALPQRKATETNSELLVSEDLFFHTTDSETVTTYDLRWKQGDSVKTLWSTKLPFIKRGKPSHYCGLFQWQRNEEGMLVLVSYTELFGAVLLQFGPNDELMAEIGVGSKWLRPDLFGHIKFEPPDKIKFLKGEDVVVDEYSIKKGALCDKDGKPIQRKVENTKFFGRAASGNAGDIPKKRPNLPYPHLYGLDPSKVSPSSLASEDLFFDVSDSATVITYDLWLKRNNTVKTIWSGQIPLVNGARPAFLSSSVTWRKNDQGMLALVNYDNFQGKLLLFGPKDELIAEMNVGVEWLRSDQFGTVMLEPPDRIKFVGSKGETLKEYLIKDGGLYYKSGLPYERNPAALQAIEGPSKHTSE